MLRWTGLMVAVMLFAACEIKDTAEDIQRNTRELRKNSEDLEAQTKHLAKRTDDLEAELTKKEAHAMLMYHLDLLFGEGQFAPRLGWGGVSQNNEPDLLLAGGGAVQSMLFQFWKGDYYEDLSMLDRRFELSVEVLFVRLLKHIPVSGEVDVWVPDRSYKGVASLAAKLDLLDMRFEESLRRAGLPSYSLYNVLVEALRGRGKMERLEALPRTTAKILQFKEQAVYLLQLRHNLLPLMVVSQITDFKDRGDLSRLWMRYFGAESDVGGADPEQLREWTKWLEQAAETRETLLAMGIAPLYNSMFAHLVAGVDFGQRGLVAEAGAPGSGAARTSGHEQLLRGFAEAYVRVSDEALGVEGSAPAEQEQNQDHESVEP